MNSKLMLKLYETQQGANPQNSKKTESGKQPLSTPKLQPAAKNSEEEYMGVQIEDESDNKKDVTKIDLLNLKLENLRSKRDKCKNAEECEKLDKQIKKVEEELQEISKKNEILKKMVHENNDNFKFGS